MARSNRGGVFGLIRGSVGPATYSIGKTTNGKKLQIVREKPTDIANPRTRAQALQRMKLKPIFFAQQLMRDIVDHSFQGVENGQPSLRHFLSLAMKENDIPYLNRGSLDTAIGGYIVSTGDLGDGMTRVRQSDDSYDEVLYGKYIPVSAIAVYPRTDLVVLNRETYDGTYANFCAQMLNPSFKASVKDGQELAVLTFVNRFLSGAHSIEMRKMRALINTQYRTDTDAAYSITIENGDNDVTVKSNVLQALCEYNPAYATELIALAKKLATTVQVPETGTDAEKQLYCLYAIDNSLFKYAMGIAGSADEYGNGFVGWLGDAFVSRNAAKYAPQTPTEALVDGTVAAVAVIVSERINGQWHFTTSDICLQQGYRYFVNSDIRFENAIASYMTEEGGSQSTSDKYLHLEEYGYDLRQAVFTIRYRENGVIKTAQVIGGANTIEDEPNVLFTYVDTDDNNKVKLCAPGFTISYGIETDWLISDEFLLVDYSEVSF